MESIALKPKAACCAGGVNASETKIKKVKPLPASVQPAAPAGDAPSLSEKKVENLGSATGILLSFDEKKDQVLAVFDKEVKTNEETIKSDNRKWTAAKAIVIGLAIIGGAAVVACLAMAFFPAITPFLLGATLASFAIAPFIVGLAGGTALGVASLLYNRLKYIDERKHHFQHENAQYKKAIEIIKKPSFENIVEQYEGMFDSKDFLYSLDFYSLLQRNEEKDKLIAEGKKLGDDFDKRQKEIENCKNAVPVDEGKLTEARHELLKVKYLANENLKKSMDNDLICQELVDNLHRYKLPINPAATNVA